MKYTKLEVSLAAGLLCALVWCALEPKILMNWWCAAFEPLCDGVLTFFSSMMDIKTPSGMLLFVYYAFIVAERGQNSKAGRK